MATNFPASLDTLTNPTSSDSLSSPSHSAQHANVNDAVEALQAKVGADSSAVTTSLDYRVGQLETGGGGMTVSSTAPSSPVEGDMWYDDTSGRTYVYYDDGSSQQWVEFGAPPSGIGKILQVVSTTKTDTFTATIAAAGGSASVTGLTAAITPSSATSKILVMVDINGTRDVGSGNGYPQVTFSITRNGTAISVGDTAGSRVSITNGIIAPVGGVNSLGAASATFLDSPATTSPITYGIDIHSITSTTNVTYYVNRSVTDSSSVTYPRATSTITVMEVSA